MIDIDKIYNEDCLETLAKMSDGFLDMIVTSPPYNKSGLAGKKPITNQIWNKFNLDYDNYNDCISEEDYQAWMVKVLDECYRCLKPNKSMFFNHKPRRHNNKLYLPTEFISKTKFDIYQLIIWNRKNSPNIRNDHLVPNTEHIYWLSKGKPYSNRNNLKKEFIGEVWEISPKKQTTHPAPFPKEIPENCILLATIEGDVVYDPFAGIGTTAIECKKNKRRYIGSEISKKYYEESLDSLVKSFTTN